MFILELAVCRRATGHPALLACQGSAVTLVWRRGGPHRPATSWEIQMQLAEDSIKTALFCQQWVQVPQANNLPLLQSECNGASVSNAPFQQVWPRSGLRLADFATRKRLELISSTSSRACLFHRGVAELPLALHRAISYHSSPRA